MKKLCILTILVICSQIGLAQTVQGKILSSVNNVTIVKVWGTHEQRGYAAGYLLADRIETLLSKYIRERFPTNYYMYARLLMADSSHIKFEPVYINEAKAMIEGMKAKRSIASDYIDILIANCFLDILGFVSSQPGELSRYGCSSLMSWGQATMNTPLSGKSIITRNLDWEADTNLVANQVMVVHLPSEANEQPWALIGFAGQLGVLSGTNKAGLTVFQHVLHDTLGQAPLSQKFEPIWISLRKAIESADYNHDGKQNTADVQDALSSNQQGYAASCIISVLAPSANTPDSLVAMVAEVTHQEPRLTFRNSSYQDSIPAYNLYAANTPVKRKDAHIYEPRYVSVINTIGNGILMDTLRCWQTMRDSSRVVNGNIQLIQVVPETGLLRMSVYQNQLCAYDVAPVTYSLDSLFAPYTGIAESHAASQGFTLAQNYPNPFNPVTTISYTLAEASYTRLTVYNALGEQITRLVNTYQSAGSYTVPFDARALGSGIYLYRLETPNYTETKKMSVLK